MNNDNKTIRMKAIANSELDAINQSCFPNCAPDEFICVRNFMHHSKGLGLNGLELQVYALIYSYSIDNAGCYYGGITYIARRFESSDRHVKRTIKSLKQRGLIVECGNYHAGDRCAKCYRIDPASAHKAKRSYVSAQIPSARPGMDEDDLIAFPDPSITVAISNTCTSDMDVTPPSGTNTCTSDIHVTPNICSSDIHVTPNTCTSDMDVTPPISMNITMGINTIDTPDNSIELQHKTSRELNLNACGDDKTKGLNELIAMSRNHNGDRYALKPYCKLISLGYKHEEIVAAYRSKIRALDARGTEDRYHPNLANWLDPNARQGARRDIDDARKDVARKAARASSDVTTKTKDDQLVELIERGNPEAVVIEQMLDECVERTLATVKKGFGASLDADPEYLSAKEALEEAIRKRDAFLASHDLSA